MESESQSDQWKREGNTACKNVLRDQTGNEFWNSVVLSFVVDTGKGGKQ